jgi:hypothetical protein
MLYATCKRRDGTLVDKMTVLNPLGTNTFLAVISSSNTSWSNEAIIALTSLIVMIVLSFVSLVCKYGPSIRGQWYATQYLTSPSGTYPPSSLRQDGINDSQILN